MKTVLSVKVDRDLKEKATRLASDLRMPLSTIINGQLLEFVNTGSFTVTKSLVPSPRLRKVIAKAERDLSEGKNINSFAHMSDAIAHLSTL